MSGIRTLDDIRDRCFVDDITGCWLWRGAMAHATPSMRLPELDRTVGAGVAICVLTTGETPAPGVVWHRTCRSQLCVAPEHRQPGTRSTQMAFMLGVPKTSATKARIAASKRRRSKVTPEVVEEIRSSSESSVALAAKHGMSVTHACRIRRHEAHARIDGSVFGWRP